MLLGKPLARQEDLLRLRHRLHRQLSARLTPGIEVTTRVLLRVRQGAVVEGDLWCTTRRAWVPPLQQQEAHPVTLVRRLAGKRCEVVRARQMQARQQVWLRERRWRPPEDRLSRQLGLRVRRPRLLAPRLTRWPGSLVRLLGLRCCREEAARRRLHVQQVKLLGRQGGQHRHRLVQRVQPWSVAADQRRRQEQPQPRWLELQVRALRRRRLQQARLQVLLWLLMVDRRPRRLVQQERRPRTQERRQSRQLRSLVRLLELRWCTRVAASRRL